MNVLNMDGVTYDIDKLDQEGQVACILLSKVQGKIQEATMELDILTASSIQLNEKIKDALTDDAIVEDTIDEETPDKLTGSE